MTPASRATITDHGQIMPILRSRQQTARHHGLSGLLVPLQNSPQVL
jgi:hypothetical protein